MVTHPSTSGGRRNPGRLQAHPGAGRNISPVGMQQQPLRLARSLDEQPNAEPSLGSAGNLDSVGRQDSYGGRTATSLYFRDVSWSPFGRNRGDNASSSSSDNDSTADDGCSVLREVHGAALSGEMVAFVEAGGAGGHTLLRLLCGMGRSTGRPIGRSSGVLVVEQNGRREEHPMGTLEKNGLASLVTHDDALRGCLSVRETLHSAAALQLPDVSPANRVIWIDQILRGLRLQHLVNDLVASLSAGERRRLSVGCDALLSRASLIFIDDPTEDLYLHDAQLVCECLRRIARDINCTIIISLRKPTAEILKHIDRVTLLAFETMVFSGKLDVLQKFLHSSALISPQAALDSTSALAPAAGLSTAGSVKSQWLQRILDVLSHPGEAIELATAFSKSDYYLDLQVKRISSGAITNATGSDRYNAARKVRRLTFGSQVRVLLVREATMMWREGSNNTKSVLQASIGWCLVFGLIAWQLESTAGSAHTRMHILNMLIDLPSFLEVGWTRAYIVSRPRSEKDVASGAASVQAVCCVWFILTILRSLVTTVPVMVIAWPMITFGTSAVEWLEIFCMLLMAKTIMLMFFLLFSVRASSQEGAVALMAPVFLFWYQCRGWFVRKQACTEASRWLLHLNPARSVWQRMTVLIFKGEQLPCVSGEQWTAFDSVQQVCPLPGNLLLSHDSLVDDAFNDVLICGAWLVFMFFAFYRAIYAKNSSENLKDSGVVCLSNTCCKKSEDNPDAVQSVREATSKRPHDRLSQAEDRLTRSLSFDLTEVDMFLNSPVTLEFETVRFADVTQGVVIRNASGTARPGQLTVLLGPSDFVKTSLLKVLAGGVTGGDVTGSIRVNGRQCDNLLESRIAAYVPEDVATCRDVFTVLESLQHVANLQLGHASLRVRSCLIFDVLRGLRLFRKRDTRISELSAGEKRRLSIAANGLLSPSRLLLLDEPCRGLLPPDELALMSMLKDLCQTYRYTVVFSAHEPQSEVMAMVDDVLLLSGAETLFSGPRDEAAAFFLHAGFPLKNGQSEAVQMVAIASDKKAALIVRELFAARHPLSSTATDEATLELEDCTDRSAVFPRSCANEFWCLLCRDIRVQLREPMTSKLFAFNIIATTLTFALLYWRFDQNAENIPSISGAIWNAQASYQLVVITSSSYHQLAWCAAQKQDTEYSRYGVVVSCTTDFLVTLIRLILAGAVFGSLQFIATGLDAGANDFMGVVVPLTAVGLTIDSLVFGLVCFSASPSGFIDEILPSVNFMLNALGGYFIHLTILPASLQWLAACNPVAAAYSLSMFGYFSGKMVGCGYVEANLSHVPCPVDGDVVLQILDVSTDEQSRVWNMVLLAVWPVFLRILGAISLRRRVRSRKRPAQWEDGITADTVTWRYRFVVNIIAKPILKVFYREIAVVGVENLSGRAPTLLAHNQSNMAMDPMVMVALSARINRLISPMLPTSVTHPENTDSQDIGGQQGQGLKFLVRNARAVPFDQQTFASSYAGHGIIHKIYVSDGEWGIEGALFQRDLDAGCRIFGPWGEPLHVHAVASDTKAVIHTPTHPERLIPGCTQYKKRLELADDGSLVHTNAKAGPWKYQVMHQVDEREAYRHVIQRLNRGGIVSFPPEGWDLTGESPYSMGRFRTDLATVGLITATTAPTPDKIPTILPVMVHWMNPQKMRSRAIVQLGEPITIDDTRRSQYAVDPQTAAQALTDQLKEVMDEMQAPSKDIAELNLRRVLRRLLQKTDDITAAEYCGLMRFVWRRDRELQNPTTPKEQDAARLYLALLREAREYDARRAALGVPDHDIRNGRATRPGAVLCVVVVCQSILALLALTAALPGVVVSLAPILITACIGKRKTQTVARFQIKDRLGIFNSTEVEEILTGKPWLQNVSMIAFGRLSAGTVTAVLFVIMYTTVLMIVAESEFLPVSKWYALLVPVGTPFMVATMLFFLDKTTDAAGAAHSAAAALLASSESLAELTSKRTTLAARAHTIFGPAEHAATARSQQP